MKSLFRLAFDKVVALRKASLKKLPKELRRKINLLYFKRLPNRAEKLHTELFPEWRQTLGVISPRINRRRSTLLEYFDSQRQHGGADYFLHDANYFLDDLSHRVDTLWSSIRLQSWKRQGWGYMKDVDSIRLYEITVLGSEYIDVFYTTANIETSPSTPRFRQLQSILIDWIRPHTRYFIDEGDSGNYVAEIDSDTPKRRHRLGNHPKLNRR